MSSASRVSVGTSATALAQAGDGHAYQSALVVVRNTDDSASVDVGPSDVESGAGFELESGQSLSFTLEPGESLYAVAASGTVDVHVLELNRT